MRLGVLGTGMVGRTLAARWAELGHEVTVGTRNPASQLARSDRAEAFSAWLAEHPGVRLATFADAAASAEIVVNATAGGSSLDALALAGAEHLGGKILIDVANALDPSRGMPPSLLVDSHESLAERIQRAFPDARVVKTLNTLTAALMVDPGRLADGDHTVFVSGDDADAKAEVTRLLTELGHRDVVDLGDISTARGPELYLVLWLRLWGALGTAVLNVRVVR
ncbi:NADPH-dependent F420 reductase [Egicoccus sp. AB-alg2]|uniref:NADPH-dependent F420 reductase n=1 Tax=Egicoccus sp. AB-alg2 TaxID=3242693 RepID=UPI00359E3890